MSDALPQGWSLSTIADCFTDIRNGSTTPQNTDGEGLPVSRIETIQQARFDLSRVRHVCAPSLQLLSKFAYQIGDIALSHINSLDHVGKTAIYKGEPPVFLHGMNLLRLRLGHEWIDPSYIYFVMQSDSFREDLRGRVGHAVNQVSINQTRLGEISLAIAPLVEQRRIVAALDAILAKVANCQTRLARIPTILKRFRQSVLAAACSGRLTADWRNANSGIESARNALDRLCINGSRKTRRGVPDVVPASDIVQEWELPETWATVSTAELLRLGAFDDLKDGNHGAKHPKVSEFTDAGLSFITAAQVNNFQIDYDGAYKISGAALKRLRVGFALADDVIYTHKGSVGRVAIADRDCVLTPQTTYYRVNPKVFSNRFLMYFLASSPLSEQVSAVKEQTTRDFVPISEQYCLFHRIPPLAEQKEIVRRVDALFAVADQIEVRYEKARQHVDRLTQSVLAKAFRGELVPTEHALAAAEGRDYEDAATLLARIRGSEGEVVTTKSRRPRAKKSRT